MEKIKIENLTFKYPNGEAPVLSDINMTVNAGEFLCICGKSGSGKSTLLRQLKPILSPHGDLQGKIYFDGTDLFLKDQRFQAENIGFVMQNPDSQIVCDKVWHELAFGLESLSYSDTEIRGRVAETASFFGIGDWYYKDIAALSGGQKQLLNLASVMVMNPSVLILDEPTSQLDPIAARDFLETLDRINKELGTTVILSEHRLEEVLPLSDEAAVMEDGRILAKGDVKSVGMMLKEKNHPMLKAFPTPMRVSYSLANPYDTPVTIRDGRLWLSKMPLKEQPDLGKSVRASGEAVLKCKDLWFRYEKDSQDILRGLSLEIRRNEIYGIVGGNGAGKTTLLSVIAGTNRPYRGKIENYGGKKIACLPQNPQSLFVRKTVLSDLWAMKEDADEPKEIKEEKIGRVIELCDIGTVLESHPYDLSGGEAQRVALAKVLLSEPAILLLDEPTKGLDAHLKEKLAKILKGLKKSGVSIIMVSHDVEFAAKYTDRVGLFFDGHIVSEDRPEAFFSDKRFYTTAANRMARDINKEIISEEDIIKILGGAPFSEEENDDCIVPQKTEYPEALPKKTKKLKPLNIVPGVIFGILFFASEFFILSTENISEGISYIMQLASIALLSAALYNLIPRKNISSFEFKAPEKKKKPEKRTLIAVIMILFLIPVTIYLGINVLEDKNFYFTCLFIILEAMLPFALMFEGRRPHSGELVIISVLCAIAVAGRVVFMPLPQFKPVLAVVIISGLCFGGETGFLVGSISAFVSNFYFSQGPWTPWQMFAFGIIGFLAGTLFKKGILRRNKTEICIFGFFSTLVVCGILLNIGMLIISQSEITLGMILAKIVLGFPMDLTHGISTAFFLWFALEPMVDKLERIKIKYGMIEQ